jgi:hypothetical protein
MTLNQDLQEQVMIAGVNPFVGAYTTQDDVQKSKVYAYFQYKEGQKYYGQIQQGVWAPFPHFSVTGDRKSHQPFPKQMFQFFHITLPAKEGSSQGLRIFYDRGNFISIDIASLPSKEKSLLESIYDKNKEVFNTIAAEFWYAVQGLPSAVPQAKGGYQITLTSKDLPATVNFPSTAKVEKQ